MARRRRTGFARDVVEVVSLMPWWVGIALAIASFFLLHRLAQQPLPTKPQPGPVGIMIAEAMWRALASAGQYLVPVVCLAGAAVSAWRRRQRRALVTTVADARSTDVLDGMSWRQFEQLVGEAFRLQGYRVSETGGGGPDGGVDLVLTKGSERFLVQCKQWRALKVGVDVVRELYGVMAAQGAAGGFVITSGRFTEDAATFANGRHLHLLDGPMLQALIQSTRARSPQPSTRAAHTVERSASAGPATSTALNPPSCPLCSKPMVTRIAKRGPKAGTGFWGCSDYPACRGTRPAD